MYQRFSITFVITLLILAMIQSHKRTRRYKFHSKSNPRKICIRIDQTLKARHKSCFLRPDTGPCRADIIQWYYDVRQVKCYRFYWGGCQGNGNKFETREACREYCTLNSTFTHTRIPYFCSLSFEYGTCFGYFNRWAWDTLAKTCKRRLYSGCGGNQNNFHSQAECIATCLNPPNNTLQKVQQLTTCIPIHIPDIH